MALPFPEGTAARSDSDEHRCLVKINELLATGVVGGASEAHLGAVGGHSVVINGTVTRPADTTAYAAGDVVGTTSPTVITFANCARIAAGTGTIIAAELIGSANKSTKPTLELWLFDTTFTADADNALFTPTDAELLTLVKVINFATTYVGDAGVDAAGNMVQEPAEFNRQFTCPSGRDLYGALVVRNAYTPVSAEVFTVRLHIMQD